MRFSSSFNIYACLLGLLVAGVSGAPHDRDHGRVTTITKIRTTTRTIFKDRWTTVKPKTHTITRTTTIWRWAGTTTKTRTVTKLLHPHPPRPRTITVTRTRTVSDRTTVTSTVSGEGTTVTSSTTITIPGEGEVVTVTSPTTITESKTVTLPITVPGDEVVITTTVETPGSTVTSTSIVETPGPTVTSTSTVETPGPTVTSTSIVETPGPTVTSTSTVETPGPTVTLTSTVETPGPTVTNTSITTSTTTVEVVPTCAAPQAIKNPSFESGQADWVFLVNDRGVNNALNVIASSRAQQGGSVLFSSADRALTIENGHKAVQSVRVCPGQRYIFSLYMQTYDNSRTRQVVGSLNGVTVVSGNAQVGPNWGVLSAIWTAPAGSETVLVMVSISAGTGTGSSVALIDNVRLEPL